jgi:hypothetical protein
MFIQGTQQESEQRAQHLLAKGYKWSHDVAEANVYQPADKGLYVDQSTKSMFYTRGMFSEPVKWSAISEPKHQPYFDVINELEAFCSEFISIRIQDNELTVVLPRGYQEQAEQFTGSAAEDVAYLGRICSCERNGIEVIIHV